jgi:hypothetical protein
MLRIANSIACQSTVYHSGLTDSNKWKAHWLMSPQFANLPEEEECRVD